MPEPFDESTPVEWTAVWSLTAEDWRYVPTAHCYYLPPGRDAPSGPLANSNGHAAGPTLTDAVLAGLLELIERDSVAIWWGNGLRRPPVDLDRLADPAIDTLREAHAELGRDVWALDVTTDLGVPVVVAVSARRDEGAPDLLVGFGADLDVAVATRRAMTEMTMVGVLSGVLTRATRRRADRPEPPARVVALGAPRRRTAPRAGPDGDNGAVASLARPPPAPRRGPRRGRGGRA